MKLIKVEHLTANQMKDLQNLSQACKKQDSYSIPFYPAILSNPRPVASTILYYKKNSLIGFISGFFFHQDACEIVLMVDPKYRRTGISKLLLKELLSVITQYQVNYLIFSAPQGLHTAWFTSSGFTYERSEYQLLLNLDHKNLPLESNLQFREAKEDDIPTLCAINDACFFSEIRHMDQRLRYLLERDEYFIWVLIVDNNIIGKAHLHIQENHVNLSDLAILPAFQKQGFGKQLLSFCINKCIEQNLSYMTLDVEATNEKALKLYLNLNFKIVNACDYWKIPIAEITNK